MQGYASMYGVHTKTRSFQDFERESFPLVVEKELALERKLKKELELKTKKRRRPSANRKKT